MDDDKTKQKDLTGIFEIQKMQSENPETMAQIPEDPFAVNELPPTEQVESFESLDQLGMTPEAQPARNDTFTNLSFTPESPEPGKVDTLDPQFMLSNPLTDPFAAPTPEPLQEVKNYSENTQGRTNLDIKIHYPFHLKINGAFGTYERDKLLTFISENPIGLSSSDLDLQLKSGRVLLPRISEYAAVKLVQELRDSGLAFDLKPSDRDADESYSFSEPLTYHFDSAGSHTESASDVKILSEGHYTEIDQVSMVQYVKTEMIEVENSPAIQEVIERMTEALKQKAVLKGGNALFHLQKEITPLRLPSQYQISLRASVIKL